MFLHRAAGNLFRRSHWPIKSSTRCYLVDCSKVYVKSDRFGGAGSYAAVPIRKGELVERGIVRRLPVDGNHCPYVFTWSEDKTVWASGSGLLRVLQCLARRQRDNRDEEVLRRGPFRNLCPA